MFWSTTLGKRSFTFWIPFFFKNNFHFFNRYHNKTEADEKKLDNPTYVDTESPSSKDEIKKKDSCLWIRDDFSYGNTKLGFCCRRKDYSDESSELVSNKFLQIVITILVFIMAVWWVNIFILSNFKTKISMATSFSEHRLIHIQTSKLVLIFYVAIIGSVV